jgi:hypothetical protein
MAKVKATAGPNMSLQWLERQERRQHLYAISRRIGMDNP